MVDRFWLIFNEKSSNVVHMPNRSVVNMIRAPPGGNMIGEYKEIDEEKLKVAFKTAYPSRSGRQCNNVHREHEERQLDNRLFSSHWWKLLV